MHIMTEPTLLDIFATVIQWWKYHDIQYLFFGWDRINLKTKLAQGALFVDHGYLSGS